MLNRYKILIIAMITSLLPAPAYSAGYISVGGVGSHGFGHITVGSGMYGHGHLHGNGFYVSGGFYSPPVMTHSYSSYCYGAYCGGGVHYIRSAPSIDYFRGLSDAAAGVNCIGCTPAGIVVMPGTVSVPTVVGPSTIIIQEPTTGGLEPDQGEIE